MSLRTKVSAILVVCMAGVVVAHFLVGQLVVQPKFEALERERAQQHMEVVKNAFSQRVAEMSRLTKDWAYWDDSYDFVRTCSPEYIASNCTPEAFAELEINLLHVYNEQGELVWGTTRDSQTGEPIEIPGIPPSGFPADSPIAHKESKSQSFVGLVPVGDQLVLLASFPILTSESKGPVRGSLVHGKLFTEDDVQWLREQAGVDVEMLPLPATGTNSTAESASVWFDEHSTELLKIHAYLPGADGKPLRLLRVDVPRTITAEGRAVLWNATFTMLVGSTLLMIILWSSLRRLVIRPIQQLSRHVKRVASGSLTSRVDVVGNDELGEVGRALNDMTESLERHRDHLEDLVQDRTEELAKANEQLRREVGERKLAEEAAEQANRAKSEFLANISHELRTPLHGILSYAAFGVKNAKEADPDKLLGYFQRVQHSGESLLDLVTDLLDLSRLESGKSQLNLNRVDLQSLLVNAVGEFGPAASERGITIEGPRGDLSTWPTVDSMQITRVVRNLLGNAVKFSPQSGTITIETTESPEAIRISIRDQGVGIPEGEIESVFDEFVQSSKTRTGAGGTGLGLAICRQIMAAHQGRIWAENNADRGATFTVEIPCSMDAAHQETETSDDSVVGSAHPTESSAEA